MNVLVVPSNREDQIEKFYNEWKSQFDKIIVIEDGPKKTFEISCDHYSWQEIEEIMGEDNWIISREDSAIRSFGFLMANKYDPEYIFTLDDDCSPLNEDFVQLHKETIEKSTKWMMPANRRTRGMPYRNMGRLNNVVANMGLWKGNPDLNAIQNLSGENWELEDPLNKIVPQGQYFPLCGMNLCFRSEILPLMYFPLMGKGHPYKRFDDIWCGIIMKKICDHLGFLISYGNPCIRHNRMSDPLSNLKKEASGIVENESFWKKIDKINLSEDSYKKCMIEIGDHLSEDEDQYYYNLGKAILIWTEHCGTSNSRTD